MTNAQHTRGPWDVDGQFGFLDVVSSKGRIAMIDCDNDDIFGADIEANARLIAAAPELLTALESMIVNYAQFGRVTDDFVRQCANLTMKAKGA
jgi:hypothetical protein